MKVLSTQDDLDIQVSPEVKEKKLSNSGGLKESKAYLTHQKSCLKNFSILQGKSNKLLSQGRLQANRSQTFITHSTQNTARMKAAVE